MSEKWEAISRDDNYVQISRAGLLVAHVLRDPGGEVSGWDVASEIVQACNPLKFSDRILRAAWCILVYEVSWALLEAIHLYIRRLLGV